VHPLAFSFLALTVSAQLSPAQQQRETPVTKVVRENKDAVVAIQATHVVTTHQSLFDVFFQVEPQASVRGSIGSGSILHPSGYVLTNAHVAAQASELSVVLANGKSFPAHVVAAIPEDDVAIVKLDGASDLPYVRLGTSQDLMVGESVIAIGSPVGLQSTVTTGIVSALDREVAPSARMRIKGLMQTDAAINPGSSGGPLFNALGEQIGVNTAIRGDAQNVGFAIPVDRVRALLPKLLSVEAHGRMRLGIELSQDAEDGGAVIAAVARGSPAHKAGLEPGMVLKEVHGRPTRDLVDGLVALFEEPAGKPFRVRAALPEGAVDIFEVAIEALPAPDGGKLAQAHLGLEVADLDMATAARLGLRPGAGVLVRGVVRGTDAQRAGIAPGDLLTRVGPYGVRRVADLALLEGVAPGTAVSVRVVRITRGRVSQAEIVISSR
jgi:serine protease Do